MQRTDPIRLAFFLSSLTPMTLGLWQEQSVYPNKRIIKMNNQSLQKGRVPCKPRLRQNLCAQLSLDWLFFPVCRVINPTCVPSPMSTVLLTAELENISLGASGVGSGAMHCPPGMSEKPRGTMVLSCCPSQTIPRISRWDVTSKMRPQAPC